MQSQKLRGGAGIAANFYARSVLFSGRPNGAEQAIFRERNDFTCFRPSRALSRGQRGGEARSHADYFMSFNIRIIVFPNLRIFSINTGGLISTGQKHSPRTTEERKTSLLKSSCGPWLMETVLLCYTLGTVLFISNRDKETELIDTRDNFIPMLIPYYIALVR